MLSIVLTGSTMILLGIRTFQASRKGTGYWASGLFVCAASFLLLGFRGDLPPFSSIVLANLGISTGFLMLLRGVLIFTDQRPLWILEIIVTLIMTVLFWYFTYIHESVASRIVVVSSTVSLISFIASATLFRKKKAAWQNAAKGAAILFGINGAYMAFRAGITLQAGDISSFMDAGDFQALAFIVLTFFFTGITFSFIWMNYSALEGQWHTMLNAVRHCSSSIMVTDVHGDIEYVNPIFTEKTGYPFDEVVGKNPRFLKSGETQAEEYKQLWETITSGRTWRGEFHNKTKDGTLFWESASIAPVITKDGKVSHFVGVKEDITQRKQMEKQLNYLATHDTLTDLPTRRMVMDRLSRALIIAGRNKTMAAVIFADLDEFKTVNDTLGHEAGDQVLKEVANRFLSTLREADTVARIGGDEFMIVLTSITDQSGAARVAKKLIEAIDQPFRLGNQEVTIGVSLGIAVFPFHGKEPTVLVNQADKAMYAVKGKGKNNFQFAEKR